LSNFTRHHHSPTPAAVCASFIVVSLVTLSDDPDTRCVGTANQGKGCFAVHGLVSSSSAKRRRTPGQAIREIRAGKILAAFGRQLHFEIRLVDLPSDFIGRLADFLEVGAVMPPKIARVWNSGGPPVKDADGPLRRAVLVLHVSVFLPVGVAQRELCQKAIKHPPRHLDTALHLHELPWVLKVWVRRLHTVGE
jgi:hypothetical protein